MTPRCNASMLAAHVGRTVRVAGKVVSAAGAQTVVELSDGGQVQVAPAPGSAYGSQFVEIIGEVADEGSGPMLKEQRATDLGDDFDLGDYDQLVRLASGKAAEIFS